MSVTAPKGFVASGVACGLKDGTTPDLALVATDDGAPVPAAAVFTSNRAAAAPVQVSREHLRVTGGAAAAVVLNSGNANAATGGRGRSDAERTCALVAKALGCATDEVLVCSTGLIGFPLAMDRLEPAIPDLAAGRDQAGDRTAALAILTTDTTAKEVVVEGDGFHVGGMAKGAAMLAPDLATMLAVLTTDAGTEGGALQSALEVAVDRSFNLLTVDGCTSTNDSVVVLASGRRRPVGETALAAALEQACAGLAAQMAADAEGATKVARVTVTGATSEAEARRAARKVAESPLVKCSLYGADPYWGRVVSELGSAGVTFDPDRVTVAYGGQVVCRDGTAADHDGTAVKTHLRGPEVSITADLGLGTGTGTVLTSDLTPGYIDENMGTS